LKKVRECGSCHECCTALLIFSLNKKEGVPCVYLEEGGCSIYEGRPKCCKDFTCQWLEGSPLVKEEWRPDLCGFLLWKGISFGEESVCLKVTRTRAKNSPEYREAVLKYAKIYGGIFSVLKKKV